MPVPRDPRWILLAETGEYSTLGRHREPNAADIAAAQDALTRVGHAGWIAIMSHSVHARSLPELVMVRPLCDPHATFEEATAEFLRRNVLLNKPG